MEYLEIILIVCFGFIFIVSNLLIALGMIHTSKKVSDYLESQNPEISDEEYKEELRKIETDKKFYRSMDESELKKAFEAGKNYGESFYNSYYDSSLFVKTTKEDRDFHEPDYDEWFKENLK